MVKATGEQVAPVILELAAIAADHVDKEYMSESMFSTYWYRVAGLKPSIRENVVISRHIYRGQTWYMLQNRFNGHQHRFNMASYSMIGLMNGERTIEQIYQEICRIKSLDTPTQDEVIKLLGMLHDADLMQCDILPSTVEFLRENQTEQKNTWKEKIINPFSMRFPVMDPDRFLEKWRSAAMPFFTRNAFAVWLLITLTGLSNAAVHWDELTASFTRQLLSQNNLIILWLVYPFVKTIHEAAHAFAVKIWGGDVNEMGVMVLFLTPLPYVDASASGSFPEKHRRIIVAAAGIMAELAIASMAMFVWLNTTDGIIRSIAYSTMLIAGISTLMFNGNPLMRYDGYYILSDLLEIPNLAQRSKAYLGYLIQRYLLGVTGCRTPVTAPGEKKWFLIYGPLAWGYRVLVLTGLIWVISNRFLTVGILLGIWGAIVLLILPAATALFSLLANPEIQKQRLRMMVLGIGVSSVMLLCLCVLPVPFWTNAQGMIRLPEKSIVRAGADCEIVKILSTPEQIVKENTPLIQGVDPFLETRIKIYKAVLQELYASFNAQPLHEQLRRKMLLEEIERTKQDLLQSENNHAQLVVKSPAPGKFVLIDNRKLIGRFIHQGEILGYIIADHRPSVRAVVQQADINLIRQKVTRVRIRLAEQMGTSMDAAIERIMPAAEFRLPSAALGTTGGGIIPVDPTDPEGLKTLEGMFQLDLTLPEEINRPHIGSRVYVRFEHGSKPIAVQLYRSLRQLVFGRFNV